MIYSKEELHKVEDILESDKAWRHIESLDNMIGDSELPTVSEMIEDSLRNYKKKSMYISKAIFFNSKKEEVGTGVAIEIETKDGSDYEVCYHSMMEDGKVPVSMLNKLMELSYLGYILKTSKETNIVEIHSGFSKGDFKCW